MSSYSSYSSYSAPQKNEYWISGWCINRKVITQEIQVYLGNEATVRPYTNEGNDGYLISTPGPCLTDEQIEDICRKSTEMYEKMAAARSNKDSDKQLKRPLHQPVMVRGKSSSHGHRRRSDERDGGSRRRNGERDHGESSRR